MKKFGLVLMLIGLGMLVPDTCTNAAPPELMQTRVVRVVLFWSKTCPHCHEIIDHVLPPLQKKYGTQLDLRMFELSDPANLQLFQTALATFNIPPEYAGVPFMIVGDKMLVGSVDIPQQLPGLIEKHLVAGGLGWPKIPGLDKVVNAQVSTPVLTPTRPPTVTARVVVNDTPVAITPVVPATAVARAAKPVVRAIMFWMKGCSHCEEVIARVLPPLRQKYGDQLEIRLVEIATTQEVEELYKLGASFHLAKEHIGVPFLVIGNRALVGSAQIPAELPGLIDQLLASGGTDFPTLTSPLPERTPSTPDSTCGLTTDCAPPTVELPAQTILRQDPAGFALALIVMLGMVVALARVGREAMTHRQRMASVASAWESWAVLVLVLLGMGVAGYLAYVEMFNMSAICGPIGHCNTVQQSPYARLFGVIPIGVLGVLGYFAILSAWLVGGIGRGNLAQWARRGAFAFAVFGVLFSLYLTLLEPFVIGAVCAWCLTSAVVMTGLMLLLTRPAFPASPRR